MNQDRFFLVFEASQSKLPLEIESECVELSSSVEDKGVVGSCINGHYLHVLQTMERAGLVDDL